MDVAVTPEDLSPPRRPVPAFHGRIEGFLCLPNSQLSRLSEVWVDDVEESAPRVTIRALSKKTKQGQPGPSIDIPEGVDRKSTRLNSSHQIISYAVFCLKKKKKVINQIVR